MLSSATSRPSEDFTHLDTHTSPDLSKAWRKDRPTGGATTLDKQRTFLSFHQALEGRVRESALREGAWTALRLARQPWEDGSMSCSSKEVCPVCTILIITGPDTFRGKSRRFACVGKVGVPVSVPHCWEDKTALEYLVPVKYCKHGIHTWNLSLSELPPAPIPIEPLALSLLDSGVNTVS